MIPKDFVEDVKKYGGFSISELRNGYIEISTEVSGKIAVSPSEVKEFFSMLGLITESDLRPSTLDAQISELNKALDKENNKERKGRLLAAHHALLWVKHPDWFEPPMSLTLMSEPLREGYLRKGGNNPACSQIIKRPLAPAPLRPASSQAATSHEGRSEKSECAIGTQWRTRWDGKAIILDRNNSGFIHVWHSDGKILNQHSNGKVMREQESEYDLLEPWREPMKK